jgi:hypothetical protein
MLHIEYQLTEQEFLDYSFYTGWQQPAKKTARLRYYILSPVASFVGVVGVLYVMDHGELKTSSIIIGVAIFLGAFIWARYRIRSVFDRHARKIIEQSGSEVLLAKTELTFDENGISGRTKVSEVKYSWEALKRKVAINNCYYLYIHINQAIVIPKRAFTFPKETEEFEKILLTHFPLGAELDNLTK